MKPPLFFILLLVSMISCHPSKLSFWGTKEKALVESFIQLMFNVYKPDYNKMMTYLAPFYMETHSIDTSQCRVNNYGILGYKFMSWNQNIGTIIFHIWGKDKFRTHEIHFKVVKEKRKLWIMFGKFEDNWIDPCYEIKTYI